MSTSLTGSDFGDLVMDAFNGAPTDTSGYCVSTGKEFPFNNRGMCGGDSYNHIVFKMDFYFEDDVSGNVAF